MYIKANNYLFIYGALTMCQLQYLHYWAFRTEYMEDVRGQMLDSSTIVEFIR